MDKEIEHIMQTREYKEFAFAEGQRRLDLKKKAELRANKAFNKGVRESLGFWNAWKYPLLKRAE